MAGGGLVNNAYAEGKAAQYEGKITVYVVLACIVAASGGLLFGYDVGISGMNSISRSLEFLIMFGVYLVVCCVCSFLIKVACFLDNCLKRFAFGWFVITAVSHTFWVHVTGC